MSLLLDAMSNVAYTENGAVTNKTSNNAILDLFAQAGAMRSRADKDISKMVLSAAEQDLNLTLKLVFWARDVLQGSGERRFFRVAIKALEKEYGDKLSSIVSLIPVYGRWDDLEVFMDGGPLEIHAINAYAVGLVSNDALCAKWMPRQGNVANKMRRFMGNISPKEYRKLLVGLSNTVEQKMCAKDWSAINYSHLPSKAAQLYRKAFQKNDKDRYNDYVAKLERGEAKVNAKALYPYEIVKAALASDRYETSTKLLDAQWKALPDFIGDSGKRIMPLCDTSGSMSSCSGKPLPIEVCLSLGLYIAERNKGIYKDAFITFSFNPTVQYIKGKTLAEKVKSLDSADWGMNTDLQKVFDILLNQAVKANIGENEMPEIILVMSDMEFDSAVDNEPNYDVIRKKYEKAGYKLPKIVFWNLAARNKDNFPVVKDTENTAMVSGFSPSILKHILKGNIPNPYETMLDMLNSDRYKAVSVA